MKRFLLTACLMLLMLAACEEPRLDPINEQRIEASLTRMRESLNAEKLAQFDVAMKRIALIEAAKTDSTGGLVTGAFGENYKPRVLMVQVIAHKTADEIIEFAKYDSAHAQKMRKLIQERIADRTAHIAKIEEAIEPARARLQSLTDLRDSGGTTWDEARDIHISDTTLGPRQIHGADCQCIGFNLVIDNQSRHTLSGMYATYVIRDKVTGKQLEASGLNIEFVDNELDSPGIVAPGETQRCMFAVKGTDMLLPQDLSNLVWDLEINVLKFPNRAAIFSPFGSQGMKAGIEQAQTDVKRLEDNREHAREAIRHLEDAAALLDFSKG